MSSGAAPRLPPALDRAWKTQTGWTGCRILQLTLNDGTVHSVLFSFGSE